MWGNGKEIHVGKWSRDTADVGKCTGYSVDVGKWNRDRWGGGGEMDQR